MKNMNPGKTNKFQSKIDWFKSTTYYYLSGRAFIMMINWLYWRYVGEVTFFGRFNGTPFIICYKKGKCQRLWIGKGGSIENMYMEKSYIPPNDFKKLMAIYDGNLDDQSSIKVN